MSANVNHADVVCQYVRTGLHQPVHTVFAGSRNVTTSSGHTAPMGCGTTKRELNPPLVRSREPRPYLRVLAGNGETTHSGRPRHG